MGGGPEQRMRLIDGDRLAQELNALRKMGSECYWSDVLRRIGAQPALSAVELDGEPGSVTLVWTEGGDDEEW